MINDNYKKLFQKLEQMEPSEKLRDGILTRIDFEKRRSAMIRLAFLGTLATASFTAMILFFQDLMREFYQYGFYQYFSLIFSDGSVVMSYWKELTLSLAESAPLIEITILLAMILVFLVSLKLAIKNIGVNYKLT